VRRDFLLTEKYFIYLTNRVLVWQQDDFFFANSLLSFLDKNNNGIKKTIVLKFKYLYKFGSVFLLGNEYPSVV